MNTGSSVVSRVNRHGGEAERARPDPEFMASEHRSKDDLRPDKDLNVNVRSAVGSFMGHSQELSETRGPINGQSKSDLKIR